MIFKLIKLTNECNQTSKVNFRTVKELNYIAKICGFEKALKTLSQMIPEGLCNEHYLLTRISRNTQRLLASQFINNQTTSVQKHVYHNKNTNLLCVHDIRKNKTATATLFTLEN